MKTEWKNIPGFSKYQASNKGTIRRSVKGRRTRVGRIIRQYLKSKKYWQCRISNDFGKMTNVTVHRLIALAFHGLPTISKPWALHRDDNKENNTPNNIYWGTAKENYKDILINKGIAWHAKGERNGLAKLNPFKVRWCRVLIKRKICSARTLSKIYKVSQPAMSSALKGDTWKHI